MGICFEVDRDAVERALMAYDAACGNLRVPPPSPEQLWTAGPAGTAQHVRGGQYHAHDAELSELGCHVTGDAAENDGCVSLFSCPSPVLDGPPAGGRGTLTCALVLPAAVEDPAVIWA